VNQQEIMLAAIGDLEVTRRALIMEIQARDERIAELEAEVASLGGREVSDENQKNGQMVLEEVEVQ
jgi:nitrate reductase NapAB chaperone NapD